MFLSMLHGVDQKENCVYIRFCFWSMLRNMEKPCLYTVLSFMEKVVFIHDFFGSARNATLLLKLLPASCSFLLFPPLIRAS